MDFAATKWKKGGVWASIVCMKMNKRCTNIVLRQDYLFHSLTFAEAWSVGWCSRLSCGVYPCTLTVCMRFPSTEEKSSIDVRWCFCSMSRAEQGQKETGIFHMSIVGFIWMFYFLLLGFYLNTLQCTDVVYQKYYYYKYVWQ